MVSHQLGLSGQCDVVEFHAAPKGVPLQGEEGLWQPYPVEYKRGKPKSHQADELQLCAQAMCLEEMLCCSIPEGALFYGEPRRRTVVFFTPELRETVRRDSDEMHQLYHRGHTPKAKPSNPAAPVSQGAVHLPQLVRRGGVQTYLRRAAGERIAMRHLLNTLFVNSEDIYLSLDGRMRKVNQPRQAGDGSLSLHILSLSSPSPRQRLSGADENLCQRMSLAFCTPGDGFSPGYPGNPPGMCCCGGHSTGQQMIPAPSAGSPAT